MPAPKRAGQALILGILLPLVILGMHPTAHDLTADASNHMTAINHFVHGVALASQPVILFGLLGLSAYLGWSDLATGAFILYALSVVSMATAALMSGFVTSDLVAATRDPTSPVASQSFALLAYSHYINQAFAKLAIVAAGVAIIMWSVEGRRSRRFPATTLLAGAVAGAILCVGVLWGRLVLDVRGIIFATALQALWMVLVAARLLREPAQAAAAVPTAPL